MSSQNASIAHVLPPDYTTIDKLIRLDGLIFKRLLKDGTICPTLKRYRISKIRRPPAHRERRRNGLG
jgi:hypothetical protein